MKGRRSSRRRRREERKEKKQVLTSSFDWNDIESRLNMTAKYIVSAVLGSFAISYSFDYLMADKKIFGGTTPKTVSNKEWWEETDKKFQAWPRTAGPPVVMNPISRQNFIVKSNVEA
ncbi:hypothetical protein LOK49_LG10G02918 [Camellia lanceoleosa]|uniref:Uncharacterized protein n=1 Tax=Camellia lanceoleosa TaxID=1840588 RepID=A0ACC0G9I8_9ERIC|nr:hypothetical protein LOK49_LG10G02918 [Camellia lanceoleosa]